MTTARQNAEESEGYLIANIKNHDGGGKGICVTYAIT
jgi:hypothetical protein